MNFQREMEWNGVKVLQDNYKEWRGCHRKRRYANESYAKKIAERTGHGVPYFCETCFGFHVGHLQDLAK